MISEARAERTEHGVVPERDGWFVLNARDARWYHADGRGAYCELEGDAEFPQIGVNLRVLAPGEPMAMYHWEADQEDFVVLSGEALLIVEGEERQLRRWDFVHCPAQTKHVIVGAGDAPCVVLALGARVHSTGPGWGGYTVDEAALRHGAGVERETTEQSEAYARVPAREPTRYRDGWLPEETAMGEADDYGEALARITVGEPQRLQGRIEIRDYDPAWPVLYEREAERLRRVLGDRIVRLEHAGSTSVPGLPAKPIVDIALEVPDTTDEEAYVPPLERAGYVLRIREPDWFEHRLFKGPDTNINLHVFSAGCEETGRMVAFRDWLRANPADRELYERTKRELAARDWTYVQQYADAKSEIVAEIMARATAARPY